MTETPEERAKWQGELAIWFGTRLTRRKTKQVDILGEVSLVALAYGLGGELDELSRDTIAIRSGFKLGIIQKVVNADGSEETG